MKILNSIITVAYSIIAAYTIYSAIMHLFVYFANQKLGHAESFRLPLIYLVCAILFGVVSLIGYRIWTGHSVHLILKSLFYLPVAAVVLYILWAILLILSSGGKWN
jgi:hypothetical protein